MTVRIKSPSTLSDIGGGFGPSKAWVNLSNAEGSPGLDFASCGDTSSIPNLLSATDWGFGLPDTISKIEFKFYGSASNAELLAFTCYWQPGKTTSSSDSFGFLEIPQTLEDLGWLNLPLSGSSSAPTPAELASGDFVLDLRVEALTLELKGIEFRVTGEWPVTQTTARAGIISCGTVLGFGIIE